MQNDTENQTPESLTPRPSERYEIDQKLVAERTAFVVECLRKQGLGRQQILENEGGSQVLRDMVWEDPSPLSHIERCQVVQNVLHSIAKETAPTV